MVLSDAITYIKEDERERLERLKARLEAEVLQLQKQNSKIIRKAEILKKEIGQVANELANR